VDYKDNKSNMVNDNIHTLVFFQIRGLSFGQYSIEPDSHILMKNNKRNKINLCVKFLVIQ